MKKRFISALLTVILMVPMFALTVHADMGPKPCTTIAVRTGGGERAVVTLLGEKENYGPHWRVEPGEEPPDYLHLNDVERQAWDVFRDYADPDGYSFLGDLWDANVSWGYFPPEVFKIAVWYPDYDVLWVSRDSYNRYAFQSDYRLNLPALGAGARSGEVDMVLKKESDVPEEVFGLLCRIAITIVIELTMARVFGFDSKHQRKIILRVNLITQLGLNVLLWLWYFFDGPLMAMLRLMLAELAVLAVETGIYLRRLREEESAGRTVVYTICANLAAVFIGFFLLA